MKTLILSLAAFGLIACSENGSSPAPTGDTPKVFGETSPVITVTDQTGTPLVGAKILFGTTYDENKMLETDARGQVSIDDKLWTSRTYITIDHPNFVRATYVGVEPVSMDVKLNPLMKERAYGISGITTGFGSLAKDKWADVSVVAPMFRREQLVGFDLSYVISDQMDQMKVMGRTINIPSNISFPKQKEKYGWFTITLNKPSYRMPFFFPGAYDLIALHGRFPFEKTIDKVRGGDNIFSVVNDFVINQGGITRVDIDGNDHEMDLPINNIQFEKEVELMSPSVDAGEVTMIVGLNKQADRYFPSGIKYVKAQENVKINFSAEHESLALAFQSEEVETDKDTKGISNKISIEVMPLNQSSSFNLLERVESPAWENDGLVFDIPADNEEVFQGGTYVSLTVYENDANPHAEVPNSQKQWEFYAPNWLDRMEVPEWPTGLSQEKNLRWEVMFLGKKNNSAVPLGAEILKEASHVSRNTLDL